MDRVHAGLQRRLEHLCWPSGMVPDLVRSAHIITYERGTTIFHAGEPADLLYLIVSGEVKLYYGNAEGERLLVTIARDGDVVGSMRVHPASANEGQAAQFFTAQALSRCRVAIITNERLARAARGLSAQELLKLVECVNGEWERFCKRFLSFLMMDVGGRLRCAITEVADTFGIADPRGKLIPLRLSHEDFGELIGASRPMVSKHLKELAQAGVFYKQDGRYIFSTDTARRPRSVRPQGKRAPAAAA
ncbi:MAG: Crp/Fnr family transcriptional regulator [Candidatus Binatia bacterium]